MISQDRSIIPNRCIVFFKYVCIYQTISHVFFFYESYDNIAIVIMESQMKAIWLDVVLNEVVPQVSAKNNFFC